MKSLIFLLAMSVPASALTVTTLRQIDIGSTEKSLLDAGFLVKYSVCEGGECKIVFDDSEKKDPTDIIAAAMTAEEAEAVKNNELAAAKTLAAKLDDPAMTVDEMRAMIKVIAKMLGLLN